jgi:hypothetical protein
MKLTLLSCAAILAVTANAAAIAQPDAEPWCVKPGQPCIKIKREAEAWCVKPGQPCIKVKRAAEAMAEAFAEAAPAPEAGAEAAAAAWCVKPGQPCIKAKRAAEALAAAVAEAMPNPEAFYESLKMRDAFPEAEPHPSAVAGQYKSSSLMIQRC